MLIFNRLELDSRKSTSTQAILPAKKTGIVIDRLCYQRRHHDEAFLRCNVNPVIIPATCHFRPHFNTIE
jgi:hypothetical protein